MSFPLPEPYQSLANRLMKARGDADADLATFVVRAMILSGRPDRDIESHVRDAEARGTSKP